MADEHTLPPRPRTNAIAVAAWAAVGLPLLWGIVETISKALALFR